MLKGDAGAGLAPRQCSWSSRATTVGTRALGAALPNRSRPRSLYRRLHTACPQVTTEDSKRFEASIAGEGDDLSVEAEALALQEARAKTGFQGTRQAEGARPLILGVTPPPPTNSAKTSGTLKGSKSTTKGLGLSAGRSESKLGAEGVARARG